MKNKDPILLIGFGVFLIGGLYLLGKANKCPATTHSTQQCFQTEASSSIARMLPENRLLPDSDETSNYPATGVLDANSTKRKDGQSVACTKANSTETTAR